jgi:hypothetical protein
MIADAFLLSTGSSIDIAGAKRKVNTTASLARKRAAPGIGGQVPEAVVQQIHAAVGGRCSNGTLFSQAVEVTDQDGVEARFYDGGHGVADEAVPGHTVTTMAIDLRDQ